MEGEKQTLELPLYQCHKKVRAAQIGAINAGENGMTTLDLIMAPLPSDDYTTFARQVSVDVGQAWLDRFKPEVGGYYVVYEDGYASFSPAAAFEAGYALIYVDAAGPFVLRKLSVSQLERLVAHGIEMELLPDGLVKIYVAE